MAASMNLFSPAVKDLQENPRNEFLAASDVLLKFANNILENPTENKFRRIRISNPNVQSKLLSASGGMECLFEMGFQEADDGECLILPQEASLTSVRKLRDEVQRAREVCVGATGLPRTPFVPAGSASMAGGSQTQEGAGAPVSMYRTTEADFYSRLQSGSSRVLHYENPSAKSKARAIVPVERLQSEAQSKVHTSPSDTRDVLAPPLDVRDHLLLGLLYWFKHSFFHWVDPVKCDQCRGATGNAGSAKPTYEDLAFGASRVEAHKCTTCGRIIRFPRYTNAEKLLDTRTGRCGEWADCFTLCCRALDFEARYVIDWTDHVWTEVFSVSQGRWLHCDPCENICDKPLLYEAGWGKKLSYVIAFSKEEVQDVSWRYSGKHAEMLQRRTLCRESWLRHTIHRMWRQKVATLPPARQKELEVRLIGELSEFLCVKNSSGEMLPGRTSGSLSWRQARGELGAHGSGSKSEKTSAQFVFSPTKLERESEVIHFCYSCSKDTYIRRSNNNEEMSGWQACVFASRSVFRKEEFDWEKVYLARTEGAEEAEITWKFDLTDSDLRMSRLELRAETAVYEDGVITWVITGGKDRILQPGSSLQNGLTFDLGNSSCLTLTVSLSGGRGNVAWQHTQLFRQDTGNESFPFEAKLYLN